MCFELEKFTIELNADCDHMINSLLLLGKAAVSEIIQVDFQAGDLLRLLTLHGLCVNIIQHDTSL